VLPLKVLNFVSLSPSLESPSSCYCTLTLLSIASVLQCCCQSTPNIYSEINGENIKEAQPEDGWIIKDSSRNLALLFLNATHCLSCEAASLSNT